MEQNPRLRSEVFFLIIFLVAVLVALAASFFSLPAKPEALSVRESGSASSTSAQIWKTSSGKNPQFIVFAFDGSKSAAMWEETRAFARDMAKEAKPIHFTYFINAAYFLSSTHRGDYQAPQHEAGKSGIGFGGTPREIEERISEVNAAHSEGHEIGSHTAGHFPGSGWSATEWNQEFASFSDLVFNISKHDPEIPASAHLNFPESEIRGFRAPDLAVSPGLATALLDHHFHYDASLSGYGSKWPYKTEAGIWEFPLGTVKLGGIRTLAMDFNFFIDQTGGKNIAHKGTSLWNGFFDSIQKAYADYFERNYSGNRAPIYIASHFSLWNDALYWESLKAFAKEECGKPEVHCVSYEELAGFLDAAPKENAVLMK